MKDKIEVINGDCLVVMKQMIEDGVLFDSLVSDPPYHLTSIVKRFGGKNAAPVNNQGTKNGNNNDPYARGARGFMGMTWDGGDIAFNPETWRLAYDLLKPGAHLAAFSATKNYHRMAVAIEDAGFEIRDQLAWIYGTGFPHSHDISKAIDRAAGAKRETIKHKARPATSGTMSGKTETRPWIEESRKNGYHESAGNIPVTDAAKKWQGMGTALKPAWEPIVLARKPIEGTIANNVLKHGVGALNIDGCRIGESGGTKDTPTGKGNKKNEVFGKYGAAKTEAVDGLGRFPANILLDGSPEIAAYFPQGTPKFFYSAKADKAEKIDREDSHPTVKPVDLMAWLCRLITPPGGRILDPFGGTGSTGIGGALEGFNVTLIEREKAYYQDILKRIEKTTGEDLPMFSAQPEQINMF